MCLVLSRFYGVIQEGGEETLGKAGLVCYHTFFPQMDHHVRIEILRIRMRRVWVVGRKERERERGSK